MTSSSELEHEWMGEGSMADYLEFGVQPAQYGHGSVSASVSALRALGLLLLHSVLGTTLGLLYLWLLDQQELQ